VEFSVAAVHEKKGNNSQLKCSFPLFLKVKLPQNAAMAIHATSMTSTKHLSDRPQNKNSFNK